MASKTVITGECIISFPRVTVPQADDRGKLKYSAAFIFPKGSDLKALEDAAVEAGTEKFGSKIKVGNRELTIREALTAGVLRSPFRTDAIAKGYPEGSTFINARTERKPAVVAPYKDAATGKPAIIPESDVEATLYPGAVVRVSLTAFGYNAPQNKGVSFALNNIQFIRDGERLDGRVAADDEFDALDGEVADLSAFV